MVDRAAGVDAIRMSCGGLICQVSFAKSRLPSLGLKKSRSEKRKAQSLRGNDDLADRPQRDPCEFQMRPGERDADDGDGERDRRDDVRERKPPSREHQPDHVADQAQRPGADIRAACETVAAHRPLAERQQSIDGDVEGGSRPRQADNGDGHDEGSYHPGRRHPQAAEDDPKYVQHYRNRGHEISLKLERRGFAPWYVRHPRQRRVYPLCKPARGGTTSLNASNPFQAGSTGATPAWGT